MNGPIPCVIYAAKSAPDEAESSTKSQTTEVRERIEREGGRLIVGEFSESGHSGYHGERGPELAAAIQRATEAAEDEGEAELWVFASSRLSRGDGTKGRQGLMKIWADLKYADVQVRSVSDDEFVRNPMLVGIAGEQNRKFAKDHGDHIARGKRAARGEGKWAGGPAPDGYVTERHLNGKKVVAELAPDPERAPIIGAMFDMAEDAVPDSIISRRLNEAGHRSKAGRPWTSRRVRTTLENPVYAGRIVRWGEGSVEGRKYRRLDEPEIMPGQHPPIIEPGRFDAIHAARAARRPLRRKSSRRDGGLLGGRPSNRYALSKLAVCGRCGARLGARTGKPKKDGTQTRMYVCANVHGSTGLCDQKPLDAQRIDRAVVDYLDHLFVDVQTWATELAKGTETKRAGLEAALATEREKIEKAERLTEKVRDRYRLALDAERETEIEMALASMDDLKVEIDEAREKAKAVRAKLDDLENEPAPHDSAFDIYNELRQTVHSGDGSLGELNERLRQEFAEFVIDRQGDELIVLPVLKPRPFDLKVALRDYKEAGEPAPTPEEIEAEEALYAASIPIWAGKTPPTLPLKVSAQNQRYYTK